MPSIPTALWMPRIAGTIEINNRGVTWRGCSFIFRSRGLTATVSLRKKSVAATDRFNANSDRMKDLEAKLTANAALQKHIVNYSKTRQT